MNFQRGDKVRLTREVWGLPAGTVGEVTSISSTACGELIRIHAAGLNLLVMEASIEPLPATWKAIYTLTGFRPRERTLGDLLTKGRMNGDLP